MPMARWWFATTAAAVAVAVVAQVIVAAGVETGFFDSPVERALNVFVFFTVQSNLIVGVTSLLLALDRGVSSPAFAVMRLMGVVAITLTFVVYHTVLRGLVELSGWGLFADVVLHTVVPAMCVIGWFVFGPRHLTTRRIVATTVAFPLVWGVFTMIRGEIVGFYPYPFTDPTEQGYARVAVNLVLVGGGFVALASIAHLVDRRRSPVLSAPDGPFGPSHADSSGVSG